MNRSAPANTVILNSTADSIINFTCQSMTNPVNSDIIITGNGNYLIQVIDTITSIKLQR